MIELICLETGAECSDAEFLAARPGSSFGELIDYAAYGYAVVFPSPMPAFDPVLQGVRRLPAQLTDKGHYEARWEVYALPAEAVAANLEARRAALLEQINCRRDELETHGFPHAGLWFQSDERSVARINSTALTASAALITGVTAEFPDWVAADNTPLPVDAQGVLALQASLTRHGGALHAHARSLKARVLAAQTAEALAAIDITAGWPA